MAEKDAEPVSLAEADCVRNAVRVAPAEAVMSGLHEPELVREPVRVTALVLELEELGRGVVV